jgi:hypothetical protein
MSKFKKGIFDLTPEQESMSKMFYKGKIIKFIIAPYSVYNDLEKFIPYTKNTFLFPEREMNMEQLRGFVSMLVELDTEEEIIVVTKEQSIILDMIDGCVRVMDYRGTLHECPCKTMMANIHTIQCDILQNEKFAPTKDSRNEMKGAINTIIKTVNDKKESGNKFEINEYNTLKMKIDVIGEQLIRVKLQEMLSSVGYIGKESRSSLSFM